MSARTEWSQYPMQVAEPRKLEITEPVEALNVRVSAAPSMSSAPRTAALPAWRSASCTARR